MAVPSLAVRLAEAEAAYHDLSIGRSVASVRDENGESVEYQRAQRASLPRLAAYVASLRRQVAGETRKRTYQPLPTKGL